MSANMLFRRFDNQLVWRTCSIIVVAMFAFYFVTVHSPHFIPDRAIDAKLHIEHGARAISHEALSLAHGVEHDRIHCSLMIVRMPQAEVLELIAPLVMWLGPLLMLVAALLRTGRSLRTVPRLPGPDRQAILQCFRL